MYSLTENAVLILAMTRNTYGMLYIYMILGFCNIFI